MSKEIPEATPSQGIPSAGQIPPSSQSHSARIADDVVGFTLCHLHQYRKDLGASCPRDPSLDPWDLLLSRIFGRRVDE